MLVDVGAVLNPRIAGCASHRCLDRRITQVELRGFDFRPGHFHRGGGRIHQTGRVIQILLAHGVGFREWFDPLEVGLSGPQPGLLFRQRTLCCGQLRLEGFGVHLEHDLALLDDAPLMVEPLVQETIHPGTDLHLLRTDGVTDELVGDRRVPGLDFDDGHF